MSERLERLGLDDGFRALAAEGPEQGLLVGRVIRVDRGQVLVETERGVRGAEPSAKLRTDARTGEDLPAVGDWVMARVDDDMEIGLVEQVLPRRSAFTRRDPKEATDVQVLAANVDIVFIVHSLATGPNVARIERELVAAWESGAQPVVVLNKADESEDAEADRELVETVALGVPVLLAVATDDEGLDAIAAHVPEGRTAVMLGPSGVGKSTIVNQIVGDDVQATGEVREGDQKGRHTTVAREIIELPGAGLIIDTPGLRAFALWEAEDGLSQAFADIEELAVGCRFRDCAHDEEPGCAVKAAVESGDLDTRRLESFHRLTRELEHLASRNDARLRAERERHWKQLSRSLKDHPKYRKGGR